MQTNTTVHVHSSKSVVLSPVDYVTFVAICVFLRRGLQHNQIRRIESSTFQQLTSLRTL